MTAAFLGQILAILSAFAFSLANVFISKTTSSRGDKGVLFSVVVTLVFSFGLWLSWGGSDKALLRLDAETVRGLWLFAAAGVSVMVFGRNLLFISVRLLGVSRASAVKRLNPFFSVILAVIILHESLFLSDIVGMVFISLAFAVLIAEKLSSSSPKIDVPPVRTYIYGVLAAAAYALAYVLRKLGLIDLPDPALGTFVSAGAGLMVLGMLGVFSERYRDNLFHMFSYLDKWVILSAVCVSTGQILLFAALAYEKVSTVAMIASLEIFVSIFLSLAVFRTETRISYSVACSAALAVIGVVLVASS